MPTSRVRWPPRGHGFGGLGSALFALPDQTGLAGYGGEVGGRLGQRILLKYDNVGGKFGGMLANSCPIASHTRGIQFSVRGTKVPVYVYKTRLRGFRIESAQADFATLDRDFPERVPDPGTPIPSRGRQ